MKFGFAIALAVAACMACPQIYAKARSAGQTSSSSSQNNSSQSKPNQKEPVAAPTPEPSASQSQTNGNPFPGNNGSVPILPSGPTVNVPKGSYMPGYTPSAFPARDQDPVPSPDSAAPDSSQSKGYSSSLTGLSDLLPKPESGKHGKGDEVIAPLPHPTPKNDISVGNYYLSTGNWRAALSRFQSASVLEPNNADVAWGLAESERHLGDYAAARAHYLKVLEYDPGSRHAKKAMKALRDPKIANAKPSSGGDADAKP